MGREKPHIDGKNNRKVTHAFFSSLLQSNEITAPFVHVLHSLSLSLFCHLGKMAEEEAKLTVSGVEMFIGQAAEQFKQFTGGRDPPLELMRDKVMERL